jgi:hypothetical protein
MPPGTECPSYTPQNRVVNLCPHEQSGPVIFPKIGSPIYAPRNRVAQLYPQAMGLSLSLSLWSYNVYLSLFAFQKRPIKHWHQNNHLQGPNYVDNDLCEVRLEFVTNANLVRVWRL